MRLIDPQQIEPDPDWDAKAEGAKLRLSSGTSIDKLAGVWHDAKDRLKSLSHGKCWYCEGREFRSDGAVDHFRPKSLYPWLAFSLQNFRYSCTFCNSIRRDPATGQTAGKGDNFPLFGGPRATHEAELSSEDRVLLDPCAATDPVLLDFLDDGNACARNPNNQKQSDRADQSIHYFHLNHSELVEARRMLALHLKDLILRAQELHDYLGGADPKLEKAFAGVIMELVRAMHERSEFSIFARRVVAGHRNYEWVDDLMQQV